MKNDIIKIIVTVAVLGLVLSSCVGSKVIDAEPGKLISAEKIKHSSKWIVCIESNSGKRYSFKHESNCWKCTAVNIPENWNAITYTNGRTFFEPVK